MNRPIRQLTIQRHLHTK